MKSAWATLAFLLAVEVGAEPCCQPQPLADADLDGDGIVDKIERSSDSGSGMSSTRADLVLSRTGKKIEVSAEFSFTHMANSTDVPPDLPEKVLQAVEAALFGCVCPEPDPSLAWLLDKEPRSIRWVEGPPSLPGAYTIQQGSRWITYAGGTHGEIARLATDPRTGYILARTAHGVLLIDEKGSRYVWLYITLDGGGQKLRFPTVVGGRIEGEQAVVRLSRDHAFYGDYQCGLLRIDLVDGSFKETWRDLESAGAELEPCWSGLEKDIAVRALP
ncbi:MAG TPA: hypothetical protein VFR31_18995 [Thermoanaerobaculia bacterium]|nr:hypothetical protein [Thermoanaerobaculia bacterium]